MNPDKHRPLGHPYTVMALGGFLGGLAAEAIHAGFLGFAVLTLGSACGLLAALGHIRKGADGRQLATAIALSTLFSMPAGVVGVLLGRAIWA